jgi:diguanylate cyclase (GGDEF)-like protein
MPEAQPDAKLPSDAIFELKLVFLRELESAYAQARDAQDRLLSSGGDQKALHQLKNFFHRIAGTAHAVEFTELGYLCAIAERMAELTAAAALPLEKVVAGFADALAAVAHVLDSHGAGKVDRPLPRPQQVATIGLLQPSDSGAERVLSKILVIDDDPFSANLIDGCLRAAGFMSSYCCQPEQALGTIASELPDLIILDVVMPGLDGFDLCRRVRTHPALQFTPVIFVTRKGDLEQRVRGLEVGGNDYIAKPFEPQELVARVRSHLQRLAALRDMAVRDGLTRCYNHKYFKMRMEQEIARARRYKLELALGILDIDHFKNVNDSHGHPAGDAALVHMANLIGLSVRSTDVVARYGGEEFGILLVQAGDAEASIITNRIRERIAHNRFALPSLSVGGEMVQVPVTVSIGVARFSPSDNLQTLLERADRALYEAKNNGRNQVRVA